MELKCPLSAEELKQASQNMLEFVWDFVLARYPNIKLATVERNMAQFVALKKQEDACKACMSVQMCPTFDGNQMNGRLDPDGVVSIWMQPCPQGYKVPKGETCYQVEQKAAKRWEKKQ